MANEEILDSWEELEDNEVLDKKLSGIKVPATKKPNRPPAEVSVLQEEGNRTQYTPQVRILKRQTDPNAANQQAQKSQIIVQKSLEQREAEYNEARLRILGEQYSSPSNANNSADTSPPDCKPVKLVKSMEDLKLEKADNNVTVLRQPRGPDGTAGFQQR